MTVNEIDGMAVSRLANPGDVNLSALAAERNGAYREIVQAIRDADTEIFDQIETFPLIADFNNYLLPRHADSIRRLERFDLSGFTPPDDTPYAVAVNPVPYAIMERMNRMSPSYTVVPPTADQASPDSYGSLLFVPHPMQDLDDGYRITWMPTAEPLTTKDQIPRIPTPLHDALAAFTLRRMLSIGGLQAAVPQMASDWIQTQMTYLVTYLNPSGRQAVTPIVRKSGLYGTRRY